VSKKSRKVKKKRPKNVPESLEKSRKVKIVQNNPRRAKRKVQKVPKSKKVQKRANAFLEKVAGTSSKFWTFCQ
jgi:hypothetical protein